MLKDERLANLSRDYNVAQFASFAPDQSVRFVVTSDGQASLPDPESAVLHLLKAAPSINIRTFSSATSKSTPFKYEITDFDAAVELVKEFGRQGYYVIVNETIDIHDGGVSGVSFGGLVEFAPDATPRTVESVADQLTRLPFAEAMLLLRKVYGTDPELPAEPMQRVEFSVHPTRVGHRREHTVVWEVSATTNALLKVVPSWPNDFSRLIGDKVFGLLLADGWGLPVPRTTVVGRRLRPFEFGTPTGTTEYWIRTSPREAVAGYYTTHRKWLDPFELLTLEDPDRQVASILSQEGVAARYSGAATAQVGEGPVIEGVRGFGDRFMLGQAAQQLPSVVMRDVEDMLQRIQTHIPSTKIEWAHDGERVWLLQLHHRHSARVEAGVLNPGNADHWISFDPDLGLEALRKTVSEAAESGAGIFITRRVGITSHVGDVLREGGVPARLAP